MNFNEVQPENNVSLASKCDKSTEIKCLRFSSTTSA